MPSREIRTCFVTGGTGFIGSHLVDLLLRDGCEVRCLLRDQSKPGWLQGKPVTIFEGDLESFPVLERAASGTDAVFHLAGVTAAPDWQGYMKVNAEGCAAVARASLEARHTPDVFVYMSSLAAVGPGLSEEVLSENRTPRPVTDYGRSKLEGERILGGMGPLPLVVVRPPAVYGPRDREMFPLFRLAARGLLPVFNPEARLSLIYVKELVRGALMAARDGRVGETYFLTHHQAVRSAELPGVFGQAVGRNVRALRVPAGVLRLAAGFSERWGGITGRMPVFNRDKVKELTAEGWVCSSEKASRDFGFTSKTELVSGLAETVLWYREMGWL